MDTDEKYRNDAIIEVEMAEHIEGAHHGRPTHMLNDDVPVDGRIHFLFRKPGEPQSGREKDGRWFTGTFPFRSAEKDDAPWFAFPDADEWERHPVWKWQNPEEVLDGDRVNPNEVEETITLSPSFGLRGDDGIYFHCHVREGEIEWL